MSRAFSKIWIMVIVSAVIAGGVFAWQYFRTSQEVFDKVILSSDSKFILGERNGKLTEIYSIDQWQRFAAKNQNLPTLESWYATAPDVEITYRDYNLFHSAILSPDRKSVAFAVGKVGGGAWGTHSIIGVLDLRTEKVDLLTRESELSQIIWSPKANYLLYLVVSSYTGGGALVVYDSKTNKKIFDLSDEDIASALGLNVGDGIHFFSEFRDVKWSLDGERIYFSTSPNQSSSLQVGQAHWVINVDGTGLEEMTIDGTANWQTYRDEKYGLEFKYPNDWYIQANMSNEGGLIYLSKFPSTEVSPATGKHKSGLQQEVITVGIDKGYYSSIDDWFNQMSQLGLFQSKTEFTVGAEKGYKAEMVPGSGTYSIFLYKGGKIFTIEQGTPIECQNLECDTLSQILSTFKFLK